MRNVVVEVFAGQREFEVEGFLVAKAGRKRLEREGGGPFSRLEIDRCLFFVHLERRFVRFLYPTLIPTYKRRRSLAITFIVQFSVSFSVLYTFKKEHIIMLLPFSALDDITSSLMKHVAVAD